MSNNSSGNNNNNSSSSIHPHGHTNQPATQNPSWNPLQIPSYIPRQPQLAHMSNERPMVRSPLAWHAPAPPADSLYNFMSANHKNLDHQISPLLSPYVRGPSLLDSMDLSVQSSRSSSSPHNKSSSTQNAILPHEFAVHKQSQQQPGHPLQHGQQQQNQQSHSQQAQIHSPNNYSIHLPPSGHPPQSHQPQTQQQQQQQQQQQRSQSQIQTANTVNVNQHIIQESGGNSLASSSTSSCSSSYTSSTNTKYLNSNGGECEMLPPPVTLAITCGSNVGSSQVTGGDGGPSSSNCTDSSSQYMRENEANIQENYAKIMAMNRNYENERKSKAVHKPVELVNKDCNYAICSNKLSHPQQQQQQPQQQHQQQQNTSQRASPKKHSPLRNYHTPQQLYSSPHASSISQNGPHTPPTPHTSPVAQQQSSASTTSPISHPTATTTTSTTLQQLNDIRMMSSAGAGNNLLDYNQLHLQHNNSFMPHIPSTHIHHHHQQQQSPHQHHHPQLQNLQQQQQQHNQPQSQPTTQHSTSFGSPGHRQLQQLSTQQQIHHHPQHQQHQQISRPPSLLSQPHLSSLEVFTSQINAKPKESEMAKSTGFTDLSITLLPNRSGSSATACSHVRPSPQVTGGTGSFGIRNASSPDNNVTSNEDSVDSNSNSSRGRRKRKPNKLARALSHDSEVDDENMGNVCAGMSSAEDSIRLDIKKSQLIQIDQEQHRERQSMTSCSLSNTSPKSLANLYPLTGSKTVISSSPPFKSSSCPTIPTDHPVAPLSSSASNNLTIDEAGTDAKQCVAPNRSEDNANKKETVENGCTTTIHQEEPHKSKHQDDVETIDKIAEMIVKTSASVSGSTGASVTVQEVINSNTRSGEEGQTGCPNIDSPKTKKQRQALKLRNAEQQNSNSNCSTNSNCYNDSLPDGTAAANDNAVLAEELRKDDNKTITAAMPSVQNVSSNALEQAPLVSVPKSTMPTTTTRPLSPANFSHSCSSSSTSSSSCSNSSRSSFNREQNNLKTVTDNTDIKPLEKIEENFQKQAIIKTSKEEPCCTVDAPIVAPVVANTCHVICPKREEALKYDEEKNADNTNVLVKECKDDKEQLLKSPSKSCFEEVENKLEEMFAGIEDEPPPPTAVDDNSFPTSSNISEVATDLNLVLELAPSTANHSPATSKSNKVEPSPSAPLPARSDRAPTTKAAKKSTIPSPVKITNTSAITSSVSTPTRVTPPRRRLSVLVEPSNILESGTRSSRNTSAIDDQPTTSAAAASVALLSKPTQDSLSSQKKQCKTKNIQRGTTNSKSKGSNSNGSKSGKGKLNNKKQSQQQQQQKKHKGKQQDTEDDEVTPARDTNGNGGGGGGGGGIDVKFKSPYILVKNDGSVSVINAPTAEDVGTEKQTKVKKGVSQHRGYAQDRKKFRGMHSSTLSNKYDADTADKTWVCVFCKRGPHRMGLGDLFGPYMISTDCDEYRMAVGAPGALDLDAVMANKRRRVDMVQWHPRNLPVVPATGIGSLEVSPNKRLSGGAYNKKKKKLLDESPSTVPSVPTGDFQASSINTDAEMCSVDQAVANGMCKASDGTYEVWLHEDCAVWAPAVFLVGARVMGLDAAVWNSTRYHCAICGKSGAIICCLQRECHAAAHIPCAREGQWRLNESDFKVYCHKHLNSSSVHLVKSSNPATTLTTTSTTSVLAELLNRPAPKPTSSNLQSQRYS